MKSDSQLRKPARIRVQLDGDTVDLPAHVEGSLVAIRAYLEFLALQRRRVLSGFFVDGMDVRELGRVAADGFESVTADTITFEELSGRLVNTACRQLYRLAEEINGAVLQVMINERSPLMRQWRMWVPQFRNPLTSLGFLRELWGDGVDDLTVGGQTLVDHVESLNSILSEVDAIFIATEHEWLDEDAMAFSAVLEEELVPWLKMLEVYLLKLSSVPLN